MRKVLLAVALTLAASFQVASAATNYVETPHGYTSYHGTGMGNAMNQGG